jgi:hypothetical protein
MHRRIALSDADQVLHGRYDKIDLPVARPVVTRVERYAGHYATTRRTRLSQARYAYHLDTVGACTTLVVPLELTR